MSMIFPHGPQKLLVFFISIMLIIRYCSEIIGRLVLARILQPRNRRIADYDDNPATQVSRIIATITNALD